MHTNRIILTLWLIGTVCIRSFSQSPILDNYVEEAVKSNLAIAAATDQLEKNVAACKRPKPCFCQSLDLDARYSRAAGDA
jgi:hypothetical protein